MRIAVVATGGSLNPQIQDQTLAFVAENYAGQIDISFAPQCTARHGHFSGTDSERLAAFVTAANDPAVDVVLFGRGGYGTSRIMASALPLLSDTARAKIYMGYSDAGFLLAALYNAKIGTCFHGPMPADILRPDGDEALSRCFDFLLSRDKKHLEPSVNGTVPTVALNVSVLSHLVGTPFMPDLSGHRVMLEDTSSYAYVIDRDMAQIIQSGVLDKVHGIRAGRFNNIQENTPDFEETPEQILQNWCARRSIPYEGNADIGHDSQNKMVPFGL